MDLRLLERLAANLDPSSYLQSLGFIPFDWQKKALEPGIKRLILNCCRQAGKSTVIAAKAIHKAKFWSNSLILLVSPSERQSKELMQKIDTFITQDTDIELMQDSKGEKTFDNKSRICALPGSEKTIRGYSNPDILIIDEASRVPDEVYMTIRPMMTGGTTELIIMSTPFGKSGFFYDTWTGGQEIWTKIEVQPVDILPKLLPMKYAEIQEDQLIDTRRKKGIQLFFSPRHDQQFLKEEFFTMGEYWYQQEYGCEFLNPVHNVFDMDLVERALGHNLGEFYSDSVGTISKSEPFWRN